MYVCVCVDRLRVCQVCESRRRTDCNQRFARQPNHAGQRLAYLLTGLVRIAVSLRAGSMYRKYRRYIADIDISVSVSYRYFRYRLFRYIDIVSVTSKISVLIRYFIVLFPTFNLNLKIDNYMSTTEYLIWQCDISLHLVTSLLVRNGS